MKKAQSRNKDNPKRGQTLEWNLIIDGSVIKVCRTLYLDTLGLKEGTVYCVYTLKVLSINMVQGDTKIGPNRIPVATKQNVVDHTSCFYVRKTNTKEYLGDDLSLAKMYRLYITWCEGKDILAPAKRWYYEYVFNHEFNSSFFHKKKRFV